MDVLRDYAHLLPDQGEALDMACGSGEGACFLAKRGLSVCAWDSSEEALARGEANAGQQGVRVHWAKRDVEKSPPAPASFDVILVAHFLYRPGIPLLIQALRPGGLLYYQTFTREKTVVGRPHNPNFLLQDNELLHLFSSLRVLAYREEGLVGNVGTGFRNRALLVGQRVEK